MQKHPKYLGNLTNFGNSSNWLKCIAKFTCCLQQVFLLRSWTMGISRSGIDMTSSIDDVGRGFFYWDLSKVNCDNLPPWQLAPISPTELERRLSDTELKFVMMPNNLMPVQSQNIRKMKNSFVATNLKIHRNRQQVPHFHVAGVQKIIIEKRNVPHVKVSALYARERATGLEDAKQSTLWNLNRKARWAVSKPLKEKRKNLHLSYRYQWEALNRKWR